ncbi:MAG TPA: stage V sporulation protein AB [Candidatus Bariatricus faecipullorum]|nr:stage V sporulation protein AB [Candidatus Bariatricus faecipullorum]
METARLVLTGIVGLAAGGSVAAGLSAFISGLGVVSDFADRTHTGNRIHFYEDCLMLGGILGNLIWIYRTPVPGGTWLLPVFGLFGGIFVGAWSMALAEILDIFPVFTRRLKLGQLLSWMILGIAFGKCAGALLFFIKRW